MKKQDKYISQPLAKQIAERAKEKGIELPESEYSWVIANETGKTALNKASVPYNFAECKEYSYYRAYDTAELGEMLPDGMQSNRIDIVNWHSWAMNFKHSFFGNTEAETRGKMYLYLLKNNLIK